MTVIGAESGMPAAHPSREGRSPFECTGAMPVHLRPGKFDARVHRFFETEPVVWLATVRPDGRPHIIPVWFWWDGSELLVFSKPDAVKVDNLRADPHLMLAVGDAENDFDVGLVEACAEVLARAVPVPAPMFDKYALWMSEIGLDPTTFIATYSQAIRIVPTRFLRWHGRTSPGSALHDHLALGQPRQASSMTTVAIRAP
jgi:PPOX class probable F420-dependent enzyme